MRSKKRLFSGSTVCVIVDHGLLGGKGARRVTAAAGRAGADLIQYRDKRRDTCAVLRTAQALRRIAGRWGSAFLVNDRPDIAAAVDADGVHLGAGDATVDAARALLGEEAIVGVSANRAGRARYAARAGADYIGAGPFFATPVKRGKRPIRSAAVRTLLRSSLPIVAIGGISPRNAAKLVRQGVRHVAVIRAVCAARDPYRETLRLRKIMAGTRV